MKKLFLYISLLSLCIMSPASADHQGDGPHGYATTGSSEKSSITVGTSQDLSQLGIPCKKTENKTVNGQVIKNDNYDCEVEKGFNSIQIMIGSMIQYATFLISLVGVLFIVINGIMYSIGGGEKTEIKDRITKSAMGLLLLLLSGVFLNAVAPWVYTV